MWKRLLLTAAVAILAADAASIGDNNKAAQFEVKLSPEQKIRQALSRLTFGARPGDFEAVRKMGVEKWIDLQLHPDRIAENPSLEARLKPLESIRMEMAEVLVKYFPQF